MAIVCNFDCELGGLTTAPNCGTLGGIQYAAWAQYDDIDWAGMVDASPSNLDGNVVDDFIMEASATFHRLEIEKDASFYQAEYTDDNRYYETVATLIFNGKDAANSAVFTNALRCCNVVLVLWGNDCSGRILGVDLFGESLSTPIRPMRITRHLDAGGQIDSDEPRDELDLTARNLSTPIFHDVDWADFQSYLPA